MSSQKALLLSLAAMQASQSQSPDSGRKRAVNVSIDDRILTEARQMGINLSQTLENVLREMIYRTRIKQWSDANHQAIDSYNQLIAPQAKT